MLGVTGAVLLGLPYGASVWSAAASHREGDKLLYLPVVGPWGAIIDRRACTTPGCRGDIGSDSLPLVANGLLQGAGAALIVVALTTPPHTESARPRAASSGPGRSSLQVHVVPASYVGGGGLAAFGTF